MGGGAFKQAERRRSSRVLLLVVVVGVVVLMVLWQRATRCGVVGVGVGIEGRLVRVRDGDVPPTEDLPVCRFQRSGRVLQKREDQSVSGSRAAIVSLVQSVHRAGG